VDFLRVTKTSRIDVEVSVQFINEDASPGLKRGGVLNIIAFREAHQAIPCHSLSLLSVAVLRPHPFTGKAGAGKQERTYRPATYLETWHVDSCGRKVDWWIFDDSTDGTGDASLLRVDGT